MFLQQFGGKPLMMIIIWQLFIECVQSTRHFPKYLKNYGDKKHINISDFMEFTFYYYKILMIKIYYIIQPQILHQLGQEFKSSFLYGQWKPKLQNKK